MNRQKVYFYLIMYKASIHSIECGTFVTFPVTYRFEGPCGCRFLYRYSYRSVDSMYLRYCCVNRYCIGTRRHMHVNIKGMEPSHRAMEYPNSYQFAAQYNLIILSSKWGTGPCRGLTSFLGTDYLQLQISKATAPQRASISKVEVEVGQSR